MIEQPLVSVCVPVRNGAPLLEQALDSIFRQTYKNLEILISDNCSADETAKIALAYVAKDPRAEYIYQEETVSARVNFSLLIEKARGEFLLFCAHDDDRSENFISILVERLLADPEAVLAFGEARYFTNNRDDAVPYKGSWDAQNHSRYPRMAKTAFRQCANIYGVWRTSFLKRVHMTECVFWPDMQLMMAGAAHGTFIQDSRAVFFYRMVPRTWKEKARYNQNRNHLPKNMVLQGLGATYNSVRILSGRYAATVAVSFLCSKLATRMLFLMLGVYHIQHVFNLFKKEGMFTGFRAVYLKIIGKLGSTFP